MVTHTREDTFHDDAIAHVRFKGNSLHRGVAGSQDGDRGDGLLMWRVAANILRKQSRTGEKGQSSSLVFGLGAVNPYLNTSISWSVTQGLGLGGFFGYSNETLGSGEGERFLDSLSGYRLFKDCSWSWSCSARSGSSPPYAGSVPAKSMYCMWILAKFNNVYCCTCR
jgi:hypothetical protein